MHLAHTGQASTSRSSGQGQKQKRGKADPSVPCASPMLSRVESTPCPPPHSPHPRGSSRLTPDNTCSMSKEQSQGLLRAQEITRGEVPRAAQSCCKGHAHRHICTDTQLREYLHMCEHVCTHMQTYTAMSPVACALSLGSNQSPEHPREERDWGQLGAGTGMGQAARCMPRAVGHWQAAPGPQFSPWET